LSRPIDRNEPQLPPVDFFA
jgi:hypothetical protein